MFSDVGGTTAGDPRRGNEVHEFVPTVRSRSVRGRILIAVLVLLPLAIAAVVWSALRPRRHRVHPGTIEVVLLDAKRGGPWTERAIVNIADSPTDGGFVFSVTAGVHHFRASDFPPRGFQQMPAYEGGEFDLIVAGAPIDEVQRLEVKVSDATRGLAKRTPLIAKPFRDVSVIVVWPDGGPAAGATVRCDEASTTTDARGTALCRNMAGMVDVAAGKDGFGGEMWAADVSETAGVILNRPAMQLEVDITGIPGHTSIAVNSSEIRRDFFMRDGGHYSLPAIPAFRTIICTRDEPVGACAIVIPDGGTAPIHVLLDAKAGGEVEFSATLRGKPLPSPIAYIDRVESRPAAATKHVFPLQPGRHVLILNVDRGPERYETLFTVEPGKRTDLGELELK